MPCSSAHGLRSFGHDVKMWCTGFSQFMVEGDMCENNVGYGGATVIVMIFSEVLNSRGSDIARLKRIR